MKKTLSQQAQSRIYATAGQLQSKTAMNVNVFKTYLKFVEKDSAFSCIGLC